MQTNLPVQAVLNEKDIVTQQIVINGVAQNVTEKVQCLCCPECDNELFTFGVGVAYEDAYKELVTYRQDLNEKLPICAKCGARLRYDFDIIDGEMIDE